MATIVNQKNEVFSNITALNVVNDDIPKLPDFNSEESINNETNSSDFLVGLINVLEGAEKLFTIVVDTMVYKLPKIEAEIKDGLKRDLKEMTSCSINPEIPDWFQNGGAGVVMKVTDIDFFNMMKVNPDSIVGNLTYTDISAGVNSKDFNTYLHYTIQEPTIPKQWGSSTSGVDILETKFEESGTNDNNVLKFTTSADYSNKKLTQFNNDYIDSLTLFGDPSSVNSANFMSLILEELFGSIVTTSTPEVLYKLETKEILKCIINSEDDNITNNFFEFDNPTLAKLSQEANNRAKGIRKIVTCDDMPVQINSKLATDVYDLIKSATTKQAEVNAVKSGLDAILDLQTSTVSTKDTITIKSSFFKDIINSFTVIIMGVIVSPKFITLFAINHQIIYGQNSNYDNAKDFISKNRKLIKKISKIILEIILSILLKIALIELSKKLKEKFAGDEIERGKLYLTRLLSAFPIDLEIVKLMTQL
jgi:hypothetical protein